MFNTFKGRLGDIKKSERNNKYILSTWFQELQNKNKNHQSNGLGLLVGPSWYNPVGLILQFTFMVG